MFEAVLALCLSGQPEMCRDVLVAGHESPHLSACEATISAGMRCVPNGKAAHFEEIAPGVFVHLGIISDVAPDNLGDVSNSGFVIGATSVAVVDTGGSRLVGEQIYRAVRARTDLPVSHVILTHMHPDHVLGASVFARSGAHIVGHSALERALWDRRETYLKSFENRIGAQAFIGTEVITPDITVTDKLRIDLGGRMLEVKAWPQSHTSSDITVMDQASGTLFAGDLVFHQHTPALDGSVIGWQAVLAQMEAMEATHVVPGHGGPYLRWPEGAGHLKAYLNVLAVDTRDAIAQGMSLGEAVEVIGQSEATKWELFDLFNPRNATVAYTELEWE